jgi:uncharacterized protein (DUF433 family)
MGESKMLQTTVIRTDRGLSIGGRRVTLYDVMDYLTDGWTTEQTREVLRLSEQEMADVMVYIRDHHTEVVTEYAQVLQKADENRRYWEERNRAHFEAIAAQPPTPEQEAMRARVTAHKRKLGLL